MDRRAPLLAIAPLLLLGAGCKADAEVGSSFGGDGGGGAADTDQLHSSCDNIVEFTEMFTHGIVAAICESDYGPYFEEATSVIDVACDEYVPP